jgi:hypothetical protein
MSGGHYGRVYVYMLSMASELEHDIEINSMGDYKMPEDIKVHLLKVARTLETLAEAARDVEYLMSDDHGYDTMRELNSWKLSTKERKKCK